MACVETALHKNDDSEMEEGEIVDDLDDLSDISSEEEFLLRQRLQVLENYNNVLERKKAKGSSIGSGKKKDNNPLHDLSEISANDLDDTLPHIRSRENVVVHKHVRDHKHFKTHHKLKKKKDFEPFRDTNRYKDHKKKNHRKKRIEVKVISESSEESDDEYRNKRRKLANAVGVHKDKNDGSSLQARLQKMLCATSVQESIPIQTEVRENDNNLKLEERTGSPTALETDDSKFNHESKTTEKVLAGDDENQKVVLVDSCTDDDVIIVTSEQPQDPADSVSKDQKVESKDKDSDDDLELLRQHALKTKASKVKVDQPSVPAETENKPLILSEDEDSDTAELRLICLKSALLKKAIEMKQKQKLKKRLSQSSNLQDELLRDQEELNKIESENNNTDIESVDMDIGSDAEEKGKDSTNDSFKCVKDDMEQKESIENDNIGKDVPKTNVPKEDELDEDEDLLRARLLTSLSKNLPKLVDPDILNSIEEEKLTIDSTNTKPNKANVPEEKRIVINVGESDSEGEHEATKNLTKMHMKLSEQLDFQQKLDMFLKSTRMEVEKTKEPDIENPELPKSPQKFVAKAVNHLPKSEQIEYKNLVKRMAELEKVKQARQSSMSLISKPQAKETLKPRNVSVDATKLVVINNVEEQFALSRKAIAEESAKILRLKEEATKLFQKYKIVANELKNISTAITLNKKEQRFSQNRLNKIRLNHQRLLKSTTLTHSKTNGQDLINRPNIKTMSINKLQKENDPCKEEYKNSNVLKSLKFTVINNLNEGTPNTKMSVQVDVNSNKKTVRLPAKDSTVDNLKDSSKMNSFDAEERLKESDSRLPRVENGRGSRRSSEESYYSQNAKRKKEFDDYESPLQALGSATWEDTNAIMCPFEVGGNCKDPDCKYLHPKIPTKQ